MRKCLIASAVIVVGVSLAAEARAQNKPATAATGCHAKPKGVPPAGQRWRYRTDRQTKQRCWFLAVGNGAAAATKKRAARTRADRLPTRLNAHAFKPRPIGSAARSPAASPPGTPPQGADPSASARDPLVGRILRYPSDERMAGGSVAAAAAALPPALGNRQEGASSPASEATASIDGASAPAQAIPAPQATKPAPQAAAPAPQAAAPRAAPPASDPAATVGFAPASLRVESDPPQRHPPAMLLLALLFGSFSVAALSIRGIVRMARARTA